MFVKLAVLACSIAVARGVWTGPLAGGLPAHQFPAGVSPQACPNFPNCANPAVAANPNAPAPYNSAPQYNPYNPAPQYGGYNPVPVPQWNPAQQSALDRGEYIGDGDYHGEGLAEALAPGYGGNNGQWNGGNNGQWNGGNNGQWNGGNNGQWNGANNGQWNQHAPAWNAAPAGVPAQIPAGVDARSCPNYPFCH